MVGRPRQLSRTQMEERCLFAADLLRAGRLKQTEIAREVNEAPVRARGIQVDPEQLLPRRAESGSHLMGLSGRNTEKPYHRSALRGSNPDASADNSARTPP